MFYVFSQNNSGGEFVIDEVRGLGHTVIIEANSNDEACIRFEAIGGYFDGVSEGYDCACCGDRWYRPYEYKTLREADNISRYSTVFTHYLDGTIRKTENSIVRYKKNGRK